jgi:general secretion pathway protein E
LLLSALVTTSAAAGDRLLVPNGLAREFLLHHGACPLEIGEAGALVVGVTPGHYATVLDDLEALYARRIETKALSPADLEQAVELLFSREPNEADVPIDANGAGADVRELADQPPVIRYVNLIVREAYQLGASDIHLEALSNGALATRLRLDGVLAEGPPPPPAIAQAVIARVKLLAELDTAERRRPQDGRIRVRLEQRELDLRVSTVPTLHGESIVIRLLDQGGRPVRLEELGLGEADLVAMQRLTSRAHGLILATGPTGSGKTSTLYAALSRRDVSLEKIVTVEDPVEYQLPGITQVPVHRTAGVTMGVALRSILRQDPDVIMVGEMRDEETTETAIQAAMTGHLVFSTLHTTDAVGAIPRLLDLGVPAYLVAATLDAVLAQRLVRRTCPECRVRYEPDAEQLALVSGRPELGRTLTRGAGCRNCRGSGFRGRIGIFELMVMTDALRDAIVRNASKQELRDRAAEGGMRMLRTDGWSKVLAGVTTVEEVLRVSGD